MAEMSRDTVGRIEADEISPRIEQINSLCWAIGASFTITFEVSEDDDPCLT